MLSSHLTCPGVNWKSSKQNHIPHEILSLQRFARGAEVSLRQLDKEARKEFDIAKSAEIQSWLRYEAVTAALRSQYHHRDIMRVEIQRIR